MSCNKASFEAMGLCAFMMAMMMIMAAGGVAGQGPAAAPPASGSDCSSVVIELADCVGYVTGSEAAPSATCCSKLSSVIKSTPECLCQLYNSTFTDTYNINISLAMQLPPACKLTTPDPSLCASIGIPVPGPSLAPMSPSGPAMAPSSVSTPSVLTPLTAPATEMQPGTNTSSPPTPNSAFSLEGRSAAAASFLLFALPFLFF